MDWGKIRIFGQRDIRPCTKKMSGWNIQEFTMEHLTDFISASQKRLRGEAMFNFFGIARFGHYEFNGRGSFSLKMGTKFLKICKL